MFRRATLRCTALKVVEALLYVLIWLMLDPHVVYDVQKWDRVALMSVLTVVYMISGISCMRLWTSFFGANMAVLS